MQRRRERRFSRATSPARSARAARPAAALLRQLRGAARQWRQPFLALLRGDEPRARRKPPRPPAKGALEQPGCGGRLLRPAADRGGDRGRGRPQRRRQRRQRGAAPSRSHRQETAQDQHGCRDPRQLRRAPARKHKVKQGKKASKGAGKVVAQTSNGTVHQVAGFEAEASRRPKKTPSWSKPTPNRQGENYIKAQQNLPDVTVVGGDPSEAPAAPTGTGATMSRLADALRRPIASAKRARAGSQSAKAEA